MFFLDFFLELNKKYNQKWCNIRKKYLHTFQKVLIILRRSCSKMDCTLKLQLMFIIIIMGLSFSVKLALDFKYFERLWYSPLNYPYKTEIEQFTSTFKQQINFCFDNLNFMYYCRGNNWYNIEAKGKRSSPAPAPPPLGYAPVHYYYSLKLKLMYIFYALL